MRFGISETIEVFGIREHNNWLRDWRTLMRRIYPVVSVVSAGGYRRLPDDEVGDVVERLVAARTQRPDGPAAPLT